MPLIQTRGSASISGYGGASVSSTPTYIEDVFSTYLYTGNGSTQTITNGIDLSGKGGLVWVAARSSAFGSYLYDTARGLPNRLSTHNANAQASLTPAFISAFNTNGFSTQNDTASTALQTNGLLGTTWTFRKQPKFFDIVTYTGTASSLTVNHNLGSTPGCVIIKCTSTSGYDWWVYHRSLTTPNNYRLKLNAIDAQYTPGYQLWSVNSTTLTVAAEGDINAAGQTYVAYLFAHDAGGFGLTGSDNVISCGSFTTDGSGNATVSLGYEPQWFLRKRTDSTGNWTLVDNMRGFTANGTDAFLYPNLSNAEATSGGSERLTSTGVQITGFGASISFIYIAIRRGPMKVPTSGTSVYGAATGYSSDYTNVATGILVDAGLQTWRYTGTDGQNLLSTRLTGARLQTSSTAAETGVGAPKFDSMNGYTPYYANSVGGLNPIAWTFRRAPGFFDVVCYTGTGTSGPSLTHNLAVIPELIFYKKRTGGIENWYVYLQSLGTTQTMYLNTTDAKIPIGAWTNTPTASQFTAAVNDIGSTYVAYLFASCAGVSKVGSYTGTGTTQQINCGFSSGSRFVLIKRTDSTGDWYVWDTARGIIAGNDPYLLLNSTAAEVTNTDYIDQVASGFELSSTAPAAINANGGTYIFLAIA